MIDTHGQRYIKSSLHGYSAISSPTHYRNKFPYYQLIKVQYALSAQEDSTSETCLFHGVLLLFVYVLLGFFSTKLLFSLPKMRPEGLGLTKNISTSHFVWQEFDFHLCNKFPGSKYTWALSTFFCFIIGFPATVAILWELFKRQRNGAPLTPNSFFMLNVSIMDAVFLAFIPPGVLNHLIWECWPIEALWNSIYSLNVCGRPLLMACSCLDCYLAVVHPVTYHNTKNMTPRILMVVIVWIWTLTFAIVFFLFYTFYFTLCSIVSFVIAIVVVGICDSFIFYTLLMSDPHRKNLQKQRAIQTLINSLVIMAFTYLPPVILITFGVYGIEYVTFVCVIAIPINITSTLGSVLMPFLHLISSGKCSLFRCRSFFETRKK